MSQSMDTTIASASKDICGESDFDFRAIIIVPPGPENFMDTANETEAFPLAHDFRADHDGTHQGGRVFDLDEK